MPSGVETRRWRIDCRSLCATTSCTLQNLAIVTAFDTRTRTRLRTAGASFPTQPYGIAIDNNGDIWMGNWTQHGLVFVDSENFLAGTGDFARYDTAPSMTNTRGVAVDSDGFIWVASSGSNRVAQFDPAARTFNYSAGYQVSEATQRVLYDHGHCTAAAIYN